MQFHFHSWLYAIRTSFWPIPLAMGLTAILAALAVMEADLAIQGRDVAIVSKMTMPLESARLALSTIAGSMITIASLVFSMTLIALTLVSQQLGPRILLHFMDDRETQVMLGLFVATFIFALIVLLRVGDEAMGRRVPALAVLLTAGLAIVALGMMIRFIHHIATRIQADVLIAELGDDLNRAAEKYAAEDRSEDHLPEEDELKAFQETFDDKNVVNLALSKSGYLRRLETGKACELAMENDLFLRMQARPGEFVLAGTPVLAVVCRNGTGSISEELQEQICALISVGRRRTAEASLEFEISALVEVALRALSPGINDPFTASACVDRLADGLRKLMQRETELPISRDQEGDIRVMHKEEPFSRYLATAFDAITESGRSKDQILKKLTETFKSLENLTKQDQQKEELERRQKIIEAMRGDLTHDSKDPA